MADTRLGRTVGQIAHSVGTVLSVSVIGALLIGSILVSNWGATLTGSNHTLAQEEALAFAKEMKFKVQGVHCTQTDTEGLGYISCTLAVEGSNGVHLEPIECARAHSFNKGCRVRSINHEK